MFNPLHDRISNLREPTIGIGTTARGVGFLIVFDGIFAHEGVPLREYLLLGTCTVPDEESICARDGYIRRIHHDRAIDDRVEVFCCIGYIYLIVSTTEIVRSYAPADTRKEIPPGARRHMDMDESSLVIMEMDAIRREHSLDYIASGDLFHVARRRKIPLLTIDIYCEICMMMGYEWSWCEYVGCKDTDDNEESAEEIFLHIVERVIRSLGP